jgi:excisionase family DNA binding protein
MSQYYIGFRYIVNRSNGDRHTTVRGKCKDAFAQFLQIWLRSSQSMDDTELLTVSQAAEALSASSQTIRNWIRADRLRAVRIGNRFLISQAEVDQLRGDIPAPHGESPWAFAGDEPAERLPRAGDGQSGINSTDQLLGD